MRTASTSSIFVGLIAIALLVTNAKSAAAVGPTQANQAYEEADTMRTIAIEKYDDALSAAAAARAIRDGDGGSIPSLTAAKVAIAVEMAQAQWSQQSIDGYIELVDVAMNGGEQLLGYYENYRATALDDIDDGNIYLEDSGDYLVGGFWDDAYLAADDAQTIYNIGHGNASTALERANTARDWFLVARDLVNNWDAY